MLCDWSAFLAIWTSSSIRLLAAEHSGLGMFRRSLLMSSVFCHALFCARLPLHVACKLASQISMFSWRMVLWQNVGALEGVNP
jgi:hypothetical protein